MSKQTKKNSIIMIGRMNPPTAGHYYVFDKMKEYARENKLDVEFVVIVVEGKETSKDKSKNPLSAEERIKFIKASGYANGFRFFVSTNAINGIEAVIEAGFEPRYIAAGSDRADRYLETLDKYFPLPDGEKHVAIPGLERDEKSSGEQFSIKSVSGTLARHAAENGYFEEFSEIVGLKDKPALAKLLYIRVRKAMNIGD